MADIYTYDGEIVKITQESDITDITDSFEFSAGQIIGNESINTFGQRLSSTAFACNEEYVDVSEYALLSIMAIVRPYSETAYTGLCFYDDAKNPVKGYFYTDATISSGQGYLQEKVLPVPSGAVYVRTSIYLDGSTIGTNTPPFRCIGYKNISDVKLLFDNIDLKNIDAVIAIPDLPEHDMTFVGDNLWTFITSGTQNNLKVYDSSFNLIASKTVSMSFDGNPFKFKSIDYNSDNHCLMIGTGDGIGGYTEDKYLYIFYEADTWLDISGTITLENCGAYTVIDFSSFNYSDYSAYGFWISDSDIIATMGKDVDIYHIQLGKGNVNLGNGVYSYIDSDKFNGTYRIIRKWTKGNYIDNEIRDSDNPYTVHGGDYYNGNLYFANSNIHECSVYKVKLQENGLYRLDVLDCSTYMNNSTEKKKYRFLDGMAIDSNGNLVSQPLYVDDANNTSQNSCLIKIKV